MQEKSVDTSSLYVQNPDVVVKEEDEDGALALNPDTDQVLVLNPSAVFIWKQCDGTKDIHAIIRAVENAFDQVPENEVAEQVTEYIDRMVQYGFIGTVEY